MEFIIRVMRMGEDRLLKQVMMEVMELGLGYSGGKIWKEAQVCMDRKEWEFKHCAVYR